ncbi:MAG: hypothetical protein JXA19_06140 [Anaerolineales bacterium]|nr:hypothetical protein [Anaerolineales bacterium]
MVGNPLLEAVGLIKSGNITQARVILLNFLKTDPKNEQGWLLLTATLPTEAEKKAALERLLKLNPSSERGRAALEKLSLPAPVLPSHPAAAPELAPQVSPIIDPASPEETEGSDWHHEGIVLDNSIKEPEVYSSWDKEEKEELVEFIDKTPAEASEDESIFSLLQDEDNEDASVWEKNDRGTDDIFSNPADSNDPFRNLFIDENKPIPEPVSTPDLFSMFSDSEDDDTETDDDDLFSLRSSVNTGMLSDTDDDWVSEESGGFYENILPGIPEPEPSPEDNFFHDISENKNGLERIDGLDFLRSQSNTGDLDVSILDDEVNWEDEGKDLFSRAETPESKQFPQPGPDGLDKLRSISAQERLSSFLDEEDELQARNSGKGFRENTVEELENPFDSLIAESRNSSFNDDVILDEEETIDEENPLDELRANLSEDGDTRKLGKIKKDHSKTIRRFVIISISALYILVIGGAFVWLFINGVFDKKEVAELPTETLVVATLEPTPTVVVPGREIILSGDLEAGFSGSFSAYTDTSIKEGVQIRNINAEPGGITFASGVVLYLETGSKTEFPTDSFETDFVLDNGTISVANISSATNITLSDGAVVSINRGHLRVNDDDGILSCLNSCIYSDGKNEITVAPGESLEYRISITPEKIPNNELQSWLIISPEIYQSLRNTGYTLLGGNIWEDLDGDQRYSSKDAAAGGLPVLLLDSSGILIDDTLTNRSGDYVFSGIEDEGDYILEFNIPEGKVIFNTSQTISANNASGRTTLISLNNTSADLSNTIGYADSFIPESTNETQQDSLNFPSFVNVPIDEGTFSENVTSLEVGTSGDLWVGSGSGIYRLSGSNWTAYKDELGITNRYVVDIIESGGSIFVLTKGDLVLKYSGSSWTTIYLPDTNQPAVEVPADVINVGEDGEEVTIPAAPTTGISGSGKSYLAPINGNDFWFVQDDFLGYYSGSEWTKFSLADLSGSKDLKVTDVVYSDGYLWLGTSDKGVARVKSDSWQWFSIADGLTSNSINCLEKGPSNVIYACTSNGISSFIGKSWTEYRLPEEITSRSIFSIFFESSNAVWINNTEGLFVIKGGQTTLYTNADGLPSHLISDMARMPNGTTYFATSLGLSRLGTGKWIGISTGAFPSPNILGFFIDGNNMLWAVTEKGLAYLDGSWFTIEEQPQIPIMSVAQEKDGTAWIANETAFAYLEDGKWKPVSYPMDEMGSPILQEITSMYFSPDGSLWFTSPDDFGKLQGGNWYLYTIEDGLPDAEVLSVTMDGNGVLWVGTEKGLFSSDNFGMGKFEIETQIPEISINAVWTDSENQIWVATSGRGVWKFDQASWRNYTATNGLTSSIITGFYEDMFGDMWALSKNGVSRFDGEDWSSFSQPGEVKTMWVQESGTSWLAGANRFTQFSP